jgi:hypothetical protein
MQRRSLTVLVVTVAGLLAGLLPAALVTSPASAAGKIECHTVSGTFWPGTKKDLQDCSGGTPNTDGAVTILHTLEGLDDVAAGHIMAAQGVKVYLFASRAQANAHFGHYPQFTTQTARCGNTAYADTVEDKPIVIEVWQNCSLGKKSTPTTKNPNIAEVALHEAGHAFDAALAKERGITVGPSISLAFRLEVRADLKIDYDTWAADNQPAKWAYICSLFGTVKPSALEIALGAEPGAVCYVPKKGSVRPVKDYQFLSPITLVNKKLPYFLGQLPADQQFRDAWAQGFALHTAQLGGPQAALPLTDRALPGLLNACSYDIIGEFWQYGSPPTSYGPGCPVEPVKAYYEN